MRRPRPDRLHINASPTAIYTIADRSPLTPSPPRDGHLSSPRPLLCSLLPLRGGHLELPSPPIGPPLPVGEGRGGEVSTSARSTFSGVIGRSWRRTPMASRIA